MNSQGTTQTQAAGSSYYFKPEIHCKYPEGTKDNDAAAITACLAQDIKYTGMPQPGEEAACVLSCREIKYPLSQQRLQHTYPEPPQRVLLSPTSTALPQITCPQEPEPLTGIPKCINYFRGCHLKVTFYTIQRSLSVTPWTLQWPHAVPGSAQHPCDTQTAAKEQEKTAQ